MGKYQAYPEYKDSGVEWIGDIPVEWLVSKVKYLTTFQVGWTPPTKDDANFEGDNLWANISDLRSREIFDTAKRISDEAAKKASMDISPKGSLLYSFKLSVGSVAFAGNDMYTNEAIATFLAASSLPLSYLYYALPLSVIQNASTNIYGARILNQELIRDALLISPTYAEATKIAAFLDHETAKIDALIEKQQQLIQLLKEKRQAVISHAVTKGLNPNAPMKDSGIEWLGEVPAHWEVAPIRRYLLEHRQGYYTTEDYVDDGVKLLRITDLRGLGGLAVDDCPRVTPCKALENFLLREGDVVFARTGGAGSFGVFPSTSERVAYASYLIRFRFFSDKFLPRYLKYVLTADSFQSAVKQNIHGGVNQNIHAEDIKNTFVACPCLSEQDDISDFLDAKIKVYGELIYQAEATITLMQERRTALISAAVTGKIDVRNFSEPATR